VIWIAGAWAFFLCWAGRRSMLDDALIHLRYAAVLHDRHFISFDGVHPSYGASSLLYVGLLALLRSFTHSPLLPKAVSLVAYAGLLGLACWIARVNRLAIALVIILVGPFGVRWLTDGMETSLACLLSVTLAVLLYRMAPAVALGAVALALSLLRVDLTLLVGFAVALTMVRGERVRAAAMCIGSGASLAFVRLTMGHLLPDTAIAKGGLPFFTVLAVTAHEIVATFSFGVGAVLLWAVSAALAWRLNRRSVLIANLPFPVLVLLAAVKGQQMHGVRYVIGVLLFSIMWNLQEVGESPRRRPVLVTAFVCALVACWAVELPLTLKIDRGRAENLRAMESAHLDRLQGEGLAADVGYIAYFSQAPICDLNGLVNGRASAELSAEQRAQACVARRPSFLFLSSSQIAALDERYQIASRTDWLDCGSVDFTNVGSDDRHWLLARRSVYPEGCPVHL
jgi:hypothetical protein